MDTPTVIYDANLLYPTLLRGFFIYLAVPTLFGARWSNDIHDEWIRNVVKDKIGFTREQGEKIREQMDAYHVDGLVTGYEHLIPTLTLPDPDDRHVLAAAIQARASVIVTFNLKDFPEDRLAPYGIRTEHPDRFVKEQLELGPDFVIEAARVHRQRMKRPAMSVEEYLDALERHGLVETAASLRSRSDEL